MRSATFKYRRHIRVLLASVVGVGLMLGDDVFGAGFEVVTIAVTIKNDASKAVTISDLFGYTDAHNIEGKRTLLKPKDAGDDFNIAADGKRTIAINPAGPYKSYTLSWLNKDGKEVESDYAAGVLTLTEKSLASATFDSPFNGLYAVLFDYGQPGANVLLPIAGETLTVDALGHPEDAVGNVFSWITVYDATASDGFIVRDLFGNPISPLVPDGTLLTDTAPMGLDFDIVPEPSTLALAAFGFIGLAAWGWRRKR